MFTIEIDGCIKQGLFIRYLGDSYKNECTREKTNLLNFGIIVENDNTCYLHPSYGEFNWVDTNNTFNISYYEEGKPMASKTRSEGVTHFKRLKVSHDNLEVLDKFVSKALSYVKKEEKGKIDLYSSTTHGYFSSCGKIYAQPIEYIYLPPDIKTQITDHIDKFISLRDRYLKFGRAYNTSLLLTGVPGSGKSSLVKGLALKYNRPVYALNFTKGMTDEKLIDLMMELKNDTILLMEDIDSFMVDRQPVNIDISFSALINVMDGVIRKSSGVITIITANNPERLDRALIRPGRVDKIIHFDYPKKPEIKQAFDDMTNGTEEEFEEFFKTIRNLKISMSGIVDYLFRNQDTYLTNIAELLLQSQMIHDIVTDKKDLYT
jgi:chaperone BCS1